MYFFIFVKKNNLVRSPPHDLGQHASLFIAPHRLRGAPIKHAQNVFLCSGHVNVAAIALINLNKENKIN
ncbi:hypothetical protein AWH67_00160 [Bartonella bacilliformis]|nr:hypothetical protein AWH67_00160 [Bartonella bacilliformis]